MSITVKLIEPPVGKKWCQLSASINLYQTSDDDDDSGNWRQTGRDTFWHVAPPHVPIVITPACRPLWCLSCTAHQSMLPRSVILLSPYSGGILWWYQFLCGVDMLVAVTLRGYFWQYAGRVDCTYLDQVRSNLNVIYRPVGPWSDEVDLNAL